MRGPAVRCTPQAVRPALEPAAESNVQTRRAAAQPRPPSRQKKPVRTLRYILPTFPRTSQIIEGWQGCVGAVFVSLSSSTKLEYGKHPLDFFPITQGTRRGRGP